MNRFLAPALRQKHLGRPQPLVDGGDDRRVCRERFRQLAGLFRTVMFQAVENRLGSVAGLTDVVEGFRVEHAACRVRLVGSGRFPRVGDDELSSVVQFDGNLGGEGRLFKKSSEAVV